MKGDQRHRGAMRARGIALLLPIQRRIQRPIRFAPCQQQAVFITVAAANRRVVENGNLRDGRGDEKHSEDTTDEGFAHAR
jgi:hypothetical protein